MLFSAWKRKKPGGWKQLYVGGIDGITPQQLQELMQKHWEWQEERRKNIWHGSEERPTMYSARKDIRMAFDMADAHGWITAALLRENGRFGGSGNLG